ncbi:MAG: bifunctional 5,10-methylene-tetrahydrofolate dehydrogenase/5,10-methylene-tetrahydrofolate cyclohydrolase [Marinilabiliales bacterium]|nr:MAG: bifunctional 5,10-methylene-tetrahydrofolate dehydrogenase/5,10-methylene-tetrahydrofolate cyclohydrolase [Marinilabiliales bacterium]
MILLDGKKVGGQIKKEIAAEVQKIRKSGGKIPHLAAVIVGNDGASETYVAHKARACDEVGFRSTVIRLEEQTTEDMLLEKIDEINSNTDIDGMIVQLPLPGHIPEQRVIERISAEKDVDGFHPVNVGKMFIGRPAFLSATPYGILELLKRYEIVTSGKHCVIIGRSNIVGKPLAALMSHKGYPGDATVTICHSRTRNLEDICRQADILVAALGRPQFVTGNMVKEGAVVIDVGISRVKSDKTKSGWKLIGDVMFDEVAPKCSHITPVPGGVGPMTIVALLTNTLKAAVANTGS